MWDSSIITMGWVLMFPLFYKAGNFGYPVRHELSALSLSIKLGLERKKAKAMLIAA